jgi:hypothetical protein
MIEYKRGQLVRKVRHPSWPGIKSEALIPLGSVGMVDIVDTVCEFGLGVAVSFPGIGSIACQYGTVIPIEDDSNHKISWDQCDWRPKEDFIQHFDLDFTKKKSV